jgi:hypothetical protein
MKSRIQIEVGRKSGESRSKSGESRENPDPSRENPDPSRENPDPSRENPDPRMILIFARLIFIFAHTRRNWARTKRRHAMLEQICSALVRHTGSGFSRSAGGVEPGSAPPPARQCTPWSREDVFEGDWGAQSAGSCLAMGGLGMCFPICVRHSMPDPPHIAMVCASTPTIAAKADLRAAHPRARRACELGRHQRRLRERRH